jgi:hypothetical protein
MYHESYGNLIFFHRKAKSSKDFEDGVVSSFFLYYHLSRVRPQLRQQLLKPRLHKTYLTISLTLKKSTIISRFVMHYKLNFKSNVMFMILDYVMLYVYGTINRAL